MVMIVDPDLLNQSVEVVFNTTNRTISLIKAGNLSDDGVAIQCIYSFCKEEWVADNVLISQPFPLKPIDGPSGTQFNLIDGWSWLNSDTTDLIRDGGWALKDANGVSQEEWMNVTSLGSFVDNANDKAYYTQGDINTPIEINLAGTANQAVQIFGDATHGDFDYRSDFIMFLREEGKTYDKYDLIIEQNISALTYKKYALPLSNSVDLKISATDAEIGTATYANIDITYFALPESRLIGGVNYDFSQIIEGDGKTLEQVYEKVMFQERQTTDIDEGAGSVRGNTSDTLMYFVGSTLYVKGFVDNILASDSNRIVFIDDTANERVNPYTGAGTFSFNSALSNDTNAIYRLFFTNDDAGDNTGRDFGTDSAVLVQDDAGVAISGDISGRSVISFSYNYDGNKQRGDASAGTDVPVTLVGIGLDGGQYVLAQGVLTRSKVNNVSLVSSDELTYSNPA